MIERQRSGGRRTLRLTAAAIAVAAVAAVCLSLGCSGDSIGEVLATAGHGSGGGNPANNSGNNNNNNGGGSVPIGKWMKENLNVPTEGSWCYNDDPANCAKYGRLYTWEAAKRACQSVGKRLPTNAEWDALVTAAGGASTAGNKLKARSGWYNNGNGTDQYGFSALPGGCRVSDGSFYDAGYYGYWWAAAENDGSVAYLRNMYYLNDYVDEYYYNYVKSGGYSVRCVKD